MKTLISAFVLLVTAVNPPNQAGQDRATVIIEVYSGDRPVEQAEVSIGNLISVTDSRGETVIQLAPGNVTVRVDRFGFTSKQVPLLVTAGEPLRVRVSLDREVTHTEEVTVTATRTETRLEDEPLHIEVVTQEEVDEKTMMTPGDIAMLLNETSGVRVQVTSPSLGAANVRIQGLRGRYTLLLADGLPLYGGQTGAIGLLQIPPLDLGQVEVLKGVASALYGPSALGGVINLISRRPRTAEQEVLFNQTTRGGTDSILWLAKPVNQRVSYSLLAGGHFQREKDIDGDGWADLPGYRRGVFRPRLYWDNGSGRSLFATAGVLVENREGGALDSSFSENLNTRRIDGGIVARLAMGSKLLTVRGSAMTQRHRHQFGDVIENDAHSTMFTETAVSGSRGKHVWVVGSAIQADLYRSRDVARFDYTYFTPSVFAQDEYALTSSMTVSASARMDRHNRYGTFLNPRISTLVRFGYGVTGRVSAGTGVFVPTPFTEETEAIGLSRVAALSALKPERARSGSADVGWSSETVDINFSVFASNVRNTLMLEPSTAVTPQPLRIENASEPTRTAGTEMFVRTRQGPFTIALSHTYVRSTEISREFAQRAEVPLTPKHAAAITAYWEREDRGRIGFEAFYTGRQRLEDNPYRGVSVPYWLLGGLVEKRFGPASVYVNAENLGNLKQSRHDPLLRPRRNFEGQFTVDQWAPLDGRVINGGIRFRFN